MKLNKTETKLLERMEDQLSRGWGCGYYDGNREFNAAVTLEKKGLVRVARDSGVYQVRTRNGDYVNRYWPQGRIYPM